MLFGNRKPPCEKFPQENYNGEDTLHSNRSESSMVLEEGEEQKKGDLKRCQVQYQSQYRKMKSET